MAEAQLGLPSCTGDDSFEEMCHAWYGKQSWIVVAHYLAEMTHDRSHDAVPWDDPVAARTRIFDLWLGLRWYSERLLGSLCVSSLRGNPGMNVVYRLRPTPIQYRLRGRMVAAADEW